MALRQLHHPVGCESFSDFLKRTDWVFRSKPVSKFDALFLDQLDDPAPEHAWLVREWFSIGDRSVVAGASRSGKSFFAIHVGLCIAMGLPMFGCKVEPGLVIYQAGEGVRGVKKRLRAWRLHNEVTFSRETPFVLLQKSIDIYRDIENVDALIEEIINLAKLYDCPLRMVVIDTLATASVGADEISGRDMGVVLNNVGRINARTGAHVLLVHHLSKQGSVRGHTSIYANVDQVILVERDEETKVRTVTLDKQKDDEEGTKVRFELRPVLIDVGEDGERVTSCVCVPVELKDKIRKEEELKGKRLSIPCELFMRAFWEAERRYGYPVPRDFAAAANVRCLVPWEDVKRAYADSSPPDVLTPDEMTTDEAEKSAAKHRNMLKSRVRRLREELATDGVLVFRNHNDVPVCHWSGAPLRAFPQTRARPPDPGEEEGEEIAF